MNDIGRLIRESWDKNDPTGWFEQVYARADSGELIVPWAYMQPNPALVAWMARENRPQAGARALVIGCGLGDDAEVLAERGCIVTAFDVSETAIRKCRERFPASQVDYQMVDLFHAPEGWWAGFDFVFESRTVQSLPYTLAEQAIGQIAGFVAPGGALLVLCAGREPHEDRRGIPWPLSRAELVLFTQYGLHETHFEEYHERGGRQFRVEFLRRAAGT
jgi:SAM-dependent methyltransferase